MRAIVIGGAGFIGSNLCKNLLDKKDTVVCFDNLLNGREENLLEVVNRDGFFLVKGDATDEDAMDNVFAKYAPECVFHLAANSDIQASAKNPEIDYQNTYSTTFHILSCMKKHDVKRLFFASTSAVYGDKRDEALDENTSNLSPISYYGAAKLGSEALISAFSYMNDIISVVFRFPNVIGPHLTHGVIYDFVKKLSHDQKKLEILGDGNQTKPYMYVGDLVDAIIRFTNDASESVLYNVGTEGETSVKEIADIICEEMGLSNVVYEYTGGECGWKGDVPRFRYCLDKIHSNGWHASYTSDEAVRKTVKEYLEGIRTYG